MDNNSRVLKTEYNFIYSLINNVIVTILGFVTRTVFIHSLGADYLGLNGLFTNVLSVLSISELGIGSAITFSLYKPIADKDNEKIKSLMYLYKKAYQVIGWVILLLGLAITPILHLIVNLDEGIEINYYVIYFMFLLNSVVSYWFFAYRSAILYANQESYITTKIETVFNLIRNVLQFLVLILFKNYYLYLLLPILLGIVKNLIISRAAGRRYPIIDEKNVTPLAKDERNAIFKNVSALSLFKVSGVVYNATDNIIISTWLGTAVVGIVSNYTMIVQMVTTYVNMFFSSMYASVGNLNASETKEYKYLVFKRLQFMNFWIYCYCTICLGCFLNPCIKVWLGGEYCLQDITVILLALTFLIPGLNNIINIYKDACGLFKEVQFRAVATAIINLVVSIVLVNLIGINGVYIGTVIAYLTTIYQVDPRVVYKKVFEKKAFSYYIDLIKEALLFGVLFVANWYIVQIIPIGGWVSLIGSFLLITIEVNFVLYLIFRRKPEFSYFVDVLGSTLRGILAKLKKV